MNCYIATRLENTAKYCEVRGGLAEIDIGISYDWTVHGPVWRSGVEKIREVSIKEFNGVDDSDFCIVILPGGRGTHCELGMALMAGKHVFILAETPEVQKMQYAVPETCAFYHHPLVKWFTCTLDLLAYCQTFKGTHF